MTTMQAINVRIADTGAVFTDETGAVMRRLKPGHVADVADALDYAERFLGVPCPKCRPGRDRRLCDNCEGTGAEPFRLTIDDARGAKA